MKAAFFYSGYGMVVSIDPGWVKSDFDTLTGIFYQVGIQTNVRKTVGVMFRPFRAAGVRADEAYTQWMTGEGRSFK